MAPSDHLGESWHELCARIGAPHLDRWSAIEPAVRGFAGLGELAADVHASTDYGHVDDVLGALLHLAAVDGGDDQDAALVVAHLMHRASRAVAVALHDLSSDIDPIVATELWMQIRSYRWRQRRHGHALGLKADTRAAVLRELAPLRLEDGRRRQLTVSPDLVASMVEACQRQGVESSGDDREPEDELLDVLSWAKGSGVLTDDDLRLLFEFELATASQRRATATAWGVTDRHLRRRCTRAKQRLQDARLAYLEHAA